MLLAFDTSSAACTAALFDDGGACIARSDEQIGRGHSERLVPMIAELLDGRSADRILVGVGPGSFTGLRVGIAAAHAFAVGIGRPFVPVVSHDAVAWSWYRAGNEGPLQVLTDARRREFAVSGYDGLDDDELPVRVEGPVLCPRDDVPDAVGTRLEAHYVQAGAVGMLAELAFAARRLPLAEDVPLYLRAPDVTPSPGKRVLQ